MKMEVLTDNEIESRLHNFEGWEFYDNALHTSIEFKDFKDAFSVMTRIAFEAEKMQHHPEWTNIYNMLEIHLSTHDAGGVTEKDFKLAGIIDALVS